MAEAIFIRELYRRKHRQEEGDIGKVKDFVCSLFQCSGNSQMDSVEYKEILKQLTSINVEIQNMGIESDRLTASIASLDTKVTAVEDFIKANPGGTGDGAATAAQLTAFADSVDASVARLDVAITPATPPVVVTTPVTPANTDTSTMTQAEKDAKEAKDAAANAQNLADFTNMH